jgi:hypothetical protein
MGVLRFRQSDTVRVRAVVLRRMAQQRAPAAADVEKGLAGTQPELAAHQVELVALRLRKRIRPVAKVCAGIDHLGIEEELIEFIAGIVVELDEILFLPLCRAPRRVAASELVADRRRALARQQQRQRLLPGETLAQIAKTDPALLPLPARGLDQADQVAALDRDVAADIAPEQVVERGSPEQRAKHARPGDRDARAARPASPERDRRPVPEPQRERGINDPGEMPEHLARGLDLLFLHPAFLRNERCRSCFALPGIATQSLRSTRRTLSGGPGPLHGCLRFATRTASRPSSRAPPGSRSRSRTSARLETIETKIAAPRHLSEKQDL